MKTYIVGLFALAIVCAVVELLSPEGEGGGIARHIKLMTGLCLLAALLTPVLSLLRQGTNIPSLLEEALDEWLSEKEQAEAEMSDRWQEQYEQMDTSMAADMIRSMLAQHFSVADTDIAVTVVLGEDGASIGHLRIALTGRAIWLNTHELEIYIEDTFGCACTIYLE
jgi:predicted PurR-regulated permease PerM